MALSTCYDGRPSSAVGSENEGLAPPGARASALDGAGGGSTAGVNGDSCTGSFAMSRYRCASSTLVAMVYEQMPANAPQRTSLPSSCLLPLNLTRTNLSTVANVVVNKGGVQAVSYRQVNGPILGEALASDANSGCTGNFYSPDTTLGYRYGVVCPYGGGGHCEKACTVQPNVHPLPNCAARTVHLKGLLQPSMRATIVLTLASTLK